MCVTFGRERENKRQAHIVLQREKTTPTEYLRVKKKRERERKYFLTFLIIQSFRCSPTFIFEIPVVDVSMRDLSSFIFLFFVFYFVENVAG